MPCDRIIEDHKVNLSLEFLWRESGMIRTKPDRHMTSYGEILIKLQLKHTLVYVVHIFDW